MIIADSSLITFFSLPFHSNYLCVTQSPDAAALRDIITNWYRKGEGLLPFVMSY